VQTDRLTSTDASPPGQVVPSDDTPHSSLTTPLAENSDDLARTALSRFFDDPVASDWWRVPEVADHFRVAYVGTAASNLAHFVNLRRSYDSLDRDNSNPSPQDARNTASQLTNAGTNAWQQVPTPLTGRTNATDAVQAETGQHAQPPLHYPYPQIRPLRSWQCESQFNLYPCKELATDVSSFPVREVREALVKAYFDQIHPTLPVISKSTFLHPNGNLLSQPPLLLFQAVLLVGAHVCTHPLVTKDRRMVKSVLFRRASMLFHLRHETDRAHMAQAALLFTWHINDGDTVTEGPWYWTGVAIRIACGLGFHRRNNRLPVFDRIIYKRIWWAAFVLEVFSSLETGRPCAIRAEDIDQSSLCEEDFKEERLQLQPNDADNDGLMSNSVLLKYHLSMVELAYIVLDILFLNLPSTTPKPDIASIDARLALWSLRSDLASSTQREGFFTSQLRIHYHLVILHLHRNYSGNSDNSQRVCNTASESIITSLERIAALGDLEKCHFTVVSAVTAAGIQIVQNIRSAIKENAFLVALNLLERLGRLLKCAKMLAQSWPNAEAMYSVFEGLRQEYERYVSQGLYQVQQVVVPEHQLDWDSLFASAQTSEPGAMGTDQEWLRLTNWTDLL